MSFGKMNVPIFIARQEEVQGADAFSSVRDVKVARVSAYKEDRHGTEKWANRAAFSTAISLFRFRVIPEVPVDTSMYIMCAGERYRILSVEDVRGRGMYIEVLADIVEPSKR